MNFDRGVGWHRVRAWVWISVALAGALYAFTGSGVRAASIQPLEIVTKSGVQVFSVEMATTEDEKTTGLMYRKELADGKGMLFDFSPEQEVSMWMKNTYISLDMIFIRADDPLDGAGERGAGGNCRDGAKIRDRARRSGSPSAVQWPMNRPQSALLAAL
jgi:hypothetical protein